MLTELRREAYEANVRLPALGLVRLSFGNASALDRARGIFAIKPSGVDYHRLRPADLVLVDLDGQRVEGKLRPSSDTPTHAALYRGFSHAGGVVHTHSLHATAFAQAGRPLPALGTTHADHFHGAVPVTRAMTRRELGADYEAATGRLICATCARTAERVPAVLVRSHGPFAWGRSAAEAVENAEALEFCAALAILTFGLERSRGPLNRHLHDRHFLRKHGASAYYGQP